MATNVEQFQLFHQLLTASRPDYNPFYFVLRPGGKEPLGERGPWKEAGVTFDEACDWMKAGYNIAIAGTDHDPLVIIDIDKEGIVEDVKPTLCVRTRKRTGRHFFYFTSDPRCKVNVPSAEHVGEVRSLWQYVVASGSFVRTDLDKLETRPPEDQLPSVGSYTIEKDAAVATITFEELPLVFRKTMADQGAQQQQAKREPKKWDKEGPQSKLWSLTIEDVIGEHPANNFPSPFHGSETGANTTVSNGLLHCWRHNVSLTPLQALVVKAGILDCMQAGDGHAGSAVGPSVIDFKEKDFVLRIWDYAKKNQIVPENDIHPFGDDQPKKKGVKKKAEKEEAKVTARRVVGDLIYTECRDGGKHFFARYNRITREMNFVDKIPETEELPYVNPGITFPRNPKAYGSPAQLYHRLKEAVNYAESQTGGKNEVFCLFIMLHGCMDPNARHNLQVHMLGPASKGKTRYVELAFMLGDRARVTNNLKEATAYRLNELLGGGLEILDEMSDKNADDTEAYIRGRYDPIGAEQRILDPRSKTDIAGFKISGPTMVSRRRAYEDDANIDRGISLICERGTRPFPLELIDRTEYEDLQDQLATFWLEHYCDQNLLPTEIEMMYDPRTENVEPRLRMAEHYYRKIAALIGAEALEDLVGFVDEQMRIRREMKSITDEGVVIRIIYGLITESTHGYEHTIEHKSGMEKVVDTLNIAAGGPGRFIIFFTRTPKGGGEDGEGQLVGINWGYVSRLANLSSRKEPAKLLLPYSVQQVRHKEHTKEVRTISFALAKLDEAFRTFLPEYDPVWKKPFEIYLSQATFDKFGPARPPSSPTTPLAIEPSVIPIETEIAPILTPDLPISVAKATEPPVMRPVITEEIRRTMQERLDRLNTTYVDTDVLQWAISSLIKEKGNGNKGSAFILRRDGRAQFPDRPDVVTRIIDSAFDELRIVSDAIYAIRMGESEIDR